MEYYLSQELKKLITSMLRSMPKGDEERVADAIVRLIETRDQAVHRKILEVIGDAYGKTE